MRFSRSTAPYLVVAAIFVIVGVMIALTRLPEVRDVENGEAEKMDSGPEGDSVFAHPHLLKGVLAQFFYVGAQVGVASFVIRYAQFSVPGMAAKTAAIRPRRRHRSAPISWIGRL